MSEEGRSGRRRILDPVERISEILFGLIMVLSFTGSLSVASAGREEVRTILVAAIGCNLAWGLVDAVMYVLTNLIERGRQTLLLRHIGEQKTTSDAAQLVADVIPSELAATISPDILNQIAERLRQHPDATRRPTIRKDDLLGAAGIFLLVFLSTFPVTLPFLFFQELFTAMRWSNGVAVVMMFLAGYSLGRYGGFSAVRTGLSMVGLGVLLVALTIALGG